MYTMVTTVQHVDTEMRRRLPVAIDDSEAATDVICRIIDYIAVDYWCGRQN